MGQPSADSPRSKRLRPPPKRYVRGGASGVLPPSSPRLTPFGAEIIDKSTPAFLHGRYTMHSQPAPVRSVKAGRAKFYATLDLYPDSPKVLPPPYNIYSGSGQERIRKDILSPSGRLAAQRLELIERARCAGFSEEYVMGEGVVDDFASERVDLDELSELSFTLSQEPSGDVFGNMHRRLAALFTSRASPPYDRIECVLVGIRHLETALRVFTLKHGREEFGDATFQLGLLRWEAAKVEGASSLSAAKLAESAFRRCLQVIKLDTHGRAWGTAHYTMGLIELKRRKDSRFSDRAIDHFEQSSKVK